MRQLVLTIALLGSLLGSLLAFQPAAAASESCTGASFPVSSAPGQPINQSMNGELCLDPAHIIPNSPVLVLIPGATYNSSYWNFPSTSFVDAANQAGYITLDLDRIGTGGSTHPDPSTISVESDAWTIHQIVQYLNGQKVVLVGHSLGSLIAVDEASIYQDVQGLVLSGFSHTLTPGIQSGPPAQLCQAPNEATGYETTCSLAQREGLFYYMPDASASVAQADYNSQDGVSSSEFGEMLGDFLTPGVVAKITASIKVPVLIVNGQNDSIFCSTATCNAAEPADFGGGKVTVDTLPLSGHDVNLALNSATWFGWAISWVAQFN